jgi:hypothetical protein
MRIILSERQYNLIMESVDGLDDFITQVIETFPEAKDMKDEIKSIIEKSNCPKIEFKSISVFGFALHNGIVLSSSLLRYNFEMFLLVLFHELAHQFQFKKYGNKIMYKLYEEKTSLDDGANFLIHTEMVANRFAKHKLMELKRRGKINNLPYMPISVSESGLRQQLKDVKKFVKENNVDNREDISEILFNCIKTMVGY